MRVFGSSNAAGACEYSGELSPPSFVRMTAPGRYLSRPGEVQAVAGTTRARWLAVYDISAHGADLRFILGVGPYDCLMPVSESTPGIRPDRTRCKGTVRSRGGNACCGSKACRRRGPLRQVRSPTLRRSACVWRPARAAVVQRPVANLWFKLVRRAGSRTGGNFRGNSLRLKSADRVLVRLGARLSIPAMRTVFPNRAGLSWNVCAGPRVIRGQS